MKVKVDEEEGVSLEIKGDKNETEGVEKAKVPAAEEDVKEVPEVKERNMTVPTENPFTGKEFGHQYLTDPEVHRIKVGVQRLTND